MLHSGYSFLTLAKPSHKCHLFSIISKALDGIKQVEKGIFGSEKKKKV